MVANRAETNSVVTISSRELTGMLPHARPDFHTFAQTHFACTGLQSTETELESHYIRAYGPDQLELIVSAIPETAAVMRLVRSNRDRTEITAVSVDGAFFSREVYAAEQGSAQQVLVSRHRYKDSGAAKQIEVTVPVTYHERSGLWNRPGQLYARAVFADEPMPGIPPYDFVCLSPASRISYHMLPVITPDTYLEDEDATMTDVSDCTKAKILRIERGEQDLVVASKYGYALLPGEINWNESFTPEQFGGSVVYSPNGTESNTVKHLSASGTRELLQARRPKPNPIKKALVIAASLIGRNA
ncbi:MAG: hypothetical protein TR69_WS6001000157 [candidate division WS6 bacterium OLB20]|uniref:Uncharacterized protein n=1 Tax=candidate division WS6 bacterium OLB20 TaxID=1617426 RepID=A0A136M064_9BACT|nr:MAG: hypothetical protein TR69_WS6001000157 [candidate division WS6 bacterium OLB20]